MDYSLRTLRSGPKKLGLFGVLAIGALALPTAVRAADVPQTRWVQDLQVRIAASGKSLSEDDMARQKGAGLSRPGFIDQRTDGLPRVLLWDEMRSWPVARPAGDGVVTGGGITR